MRPPGRSRRSRLLALALCLPAVAVTGCVGVSGEAAPTRHGTRNVPLTVLRGEGAVIARVPVYIEGRGPLSFVLDTGSSKSVVDEQVAQRLGLRSLGASRPISGVRTTARAIKLAVEHWRVGNVSLDGDTVLGVELPAAERHQGVAGLLGSDILSRWGSVNIDYSESKLVLDPRR